MEDYICPVCKEVHYLGSGCLNCGQSVSKDSNYCSSRCRVIHTSFDKPFKKCVIEDCNVEPDGLDQLCRRHKDSHCLNCARPSQYSTFCSGKCSIHSPPQEQCICLHYIEEYPGIIWSCPGTPTPLLINQNPHFKQRKIGKHKHDPPKNGRPYNKFCTNCHNKKHVTWVDVCDDCKQLEEFCNCEKPQPRTVLLKTLESRNGLAKKIREMMRNATTDFFKLPEFSSKYTTAEWRCISQQRTERLAQILQARGTAICIGSINKNGVLHLMYIGEKNMKKSDSPKFAFPGGSLEYNYQNRYERSDPNNVCVGKSKRREFPDNAAAREWVEEVGNFVKVTDLVSQKVCIYIHDPSTDKQRQSLSGRGTEVIYGLIINNKAQIRLSQIPKTQNPRGIQTIEVIWRTNHREIPTRPCVDNGYPNIKAKLNKLGDDR